MFDNLGVRASDVVGIEDGQRIDDADVERIGAVLSEVGDHVGHAHDAAFERRRTQGLDLTRVGRAPLDRFIELFKRSRFAEAQHLLRELPVVAERSVEGLQADVSAIELVHYAHGVHVVAEAEAGVTLVVFRQVTLASVAERRMPEVVAERDGLDELDVQPEEFSDSARDAAHELHVETPPAYVVVLDEGENLRLVGIAVIGGYVDYLLDVARERGARERRAIVRVVFAAEDFGVAERTRVLPICRTVGSDCRFDIRVERKVGYFCSCHI